MTMIWTRMVQLGHLDTNLVLTLVTHKDLVPKENKPPMTKSRDAEYECATAIEKNKSLFLWNKIKKVK